MNPQDISKVDTVERNPEKLATDFSRFKGILKGKVPSDISMKEIREQRLSEKNREKKK